MRNLLGLIRAGTIHLSPDLILSRYLGANAICIVIFLRIAILLDLGFDFAIFLLFSTLNYGKFTFFNHTRVETVHDI